MLLHVDVHSRLNNHNLCMLEEVKSYHVGGVAGWHVREAGPSGDISHCAKLHFGLPGGGSGGGGTNPEGP